jgi:1-acyl-sn-glycerol-3-phosphate acyltransferase
VRRAQQLRFEVFNLELGEGLAESYATELDVDPFDEFCDHLIVEELATSEIVGTYRLQTGQLAAANLGYYSEREFDFAPYEPFRCEMIELGRACVHAVFVAKRDMARWPPFGWLAHSAGTIFVDRERRFGAQKSVDVVRNAIANGSVVVIFPEGTSSDGSTVLPFKSALLESAVQLRAPIAAASIDYALDGGFVADEVCYWRDMTLVPHLLNLFFKREIRANYSFSPAAIRPR